MPVRGDELERGTVIGGYRVDELISRGGMGLVYRVTHVALNRIYGSNVTEMVDEKPQGPQPNPYNALLLQGGVQKNLRIPLSPRHYR